jgi:hypothetical protein
VNFDGQSESDANNFSRYYAIMAGSLLAGAFAYSYSCRKNTEAWLFRDDIGSPYGIKGYEEQVNTVGVDHGHNYWPSEVTFQTYNSAT